ncbi:MAG: sensor domain-containing diguanylate cyclase [Patescibacteria group bacterium]|jgi:diguanylate cyclase (GGDEF)-like protein/PAS domain S-box-containing protein
MERIVAHACENKRQKATARGNESSAPGWFRRVLIRLAGFVLKLAQSALGRLDIGSRQDRLVARQQILAQPALLSYVFDSASDAIIVSDLRGTITMFNKGAEDIFEIEADLAKGDNLFRLCTERVRINGPDVSQMLCQNSEIRNLRTQFVGLRGKMTPGLLTLNFVCDDQGREVAIVAVIKDNTEVEKLTHTDALTGLYNRRYFDHKIREEYNMLSRGQIREMTLLFLDIDFFGNFNKEYGHQIGDLVLQKVGEVLMNTVRISDAATRYGGEEFAVIAPLTNEAGGQLLAERIRQRISEIRISIPGKKDVRITASIGVKTHRYQEQETVTVLIQQANMAMLEAKRAGRNRTHIG